MYGMTIQQTKRLQLQQQELILLSLQIQTVVLEKIQLWLLKMRCQRLQLQLPKMNCVCTMQLLRWQGRQPMELSLEMALQTVILTHL